MKEEFPTWLKIMQNGHLGEARTKAFLLDRFWILERSVDIDGADFIIQRRITSQNILDRDPPRLGVVQVKFYETKKTYHHIHEEYVLDNKGKPRSEFFVLCHTGNEDNPQIYFLTAEMLHANFSRVEKDGNMKYQLSGKDIIGGGQYLVSSRKNTLDRIERKLELADFLENRKYISWQLPSAQLDIDAILPDYKEPLDNYWGNIPECFKEMKKEVSRAMFDVENIYNKLQHITEEVDPIKAFELVNEISYYCKSSQGWNIALPNLYDTRYQEFEQVCNYHFKTVAQLKKDGLLDKFLNLKLQIRSSCSSFLVKNLPTEKDMVHELKIKYSLSELSIDDFNHTLLAATEYFSVTNQDEVVKIMKDRPNCIKDISSNEFSYFWLPYQVMDSEAKLKEYYENDNYYYICYTCMTKLLNMKYPDLLG